MKYIYRIYMCIVYMHDMHVYIYFRLSVETSSSIIHTRSHKYVSWWSQSTLRVLLLFLCDTHTCTQLIVCAQEEKNRPILIVSCWFLDCVFIRFVRIQLVFNDLHSDFFYFFFLGLAMMAKILVIENGWLNSNSICRIDELKNKCHSCSIKWQNEWI